LQETAKIFMELLFLAKSLFFIVFVTFRLELTSIPFLLSLLHPKFPPKISLSLISETLHFVFHFRYSLSLSLSLFLCWNQANWARAKQLHFCSFLGKTKWQWWRQENFSRNFWARNFYWKFLLRRRRKPPRRRQPPSENLCCEE